MRSLDAKKFLCKKGPDSKRSKTQWTLSSENYTNRGLVVTRNMQKPSQKKKKNSFGEEELSVGAILRNYYELYFILQWENFCLRGGVEHRDLRLSQLRREKDGYTYTEHSSKNRAVGIAQLKLDNKSVFIAEVPEAGERCHCNLLDKYISKLPQEAINADLFYLQPLKRVVTDSKMVLICSCWKEYAVQNGKHNLCTRRNRAQK